MTSTISALEQQQRKTAGQSGGVDVQVQLEELATRSAEQAQEVGGADLDVRADQCRSSGWNEKLHWFGNSSKVQRPVTRETRRTFRHSEIA